MSRSASRTLLAFGESVRCLDTGLQGVGKRAGFGLTAEGEGVLVETNLPFVAVGFC